MRTSIQQLVILSLTAIAIVTLIIVASIVLFAQIKDAELIALFIGIVSTCVGALGGIFISRNDDKNMDLTDKQNNKDLQ